MVVDVVSLMMSSSFIDVIVVVVSLMMLSSLIGVSLMLSLSPSKHSALRTVAAGREGGRESGRGMIPIGDDSRIRDRRIGADEDQESTGRTLTSTQTLRNTNIYVQQQQHGNTKTLTAAKQANTNEVCILYVFYTSIQID